MAPFAVSMPLCNNAATLHKNNFNNSNKLTSYNIQLRVLDKLVAAIVGFTEPLQNR